MKLTTITTVIAIACVLSACSPSPRLPLGEEVIVQFDRASLGSGAPLPVPPTTEGINGASTSIRGKLLTADSQWIVVEKTKPAQTGQSIETFWIPREKVLLIQRDIYRAN